MGQPGIIHHLMQINLPCITLLKMHPECELSCFSHVQLFVTLWTVAHQGSPVHRILQQEYWSGLLGLLQAIFQTH